MNVKRHKGKLAIGTLLLLFLVAVAVWSRFSSSSAIVLTFVCSTNHPQFGNIAIFELVNALNELVNSSGGHYKPANRRGLNAQKGDWGANVLDGHKFAAHSTNIIHVWSPTNGGPYRLVLYCLPASKSTPQFLGSARVRFVSFISPWVNPSFATQARWYGSIFAESPPFEIK